MTDRLTNGYVSILHGAGYVGRELITVLAHHPALSLGEIVSRSHAGDPISKAHPHLRGVVEGAFVDRLTDLSVDAVIVAAEHGQGVAAVQKLLETGYEGVIIDMSADFRIHDPALLKTYYGWDHPAPALLDEFVYGLPEVYAPYPSGTKFIANPGCFATGIALALAPLAEHLDITRVSVTALTGASGSGARPKSTTHFPDREGNVRAYSVLTHRHLAEVAMVTGATPTFVPASGPWTRGIWGTAVANLPAGFGPEQVRTWFEEAYAACPLIRLWPDELPELKPVAGTPFCDIGWTVHAGHLVVGFAIDNLLKGAASQAVQNLNLLLGLPETAGLLPSAITQATSLA
jgi:LysW-gamma-L-alpha-aminoadipyl-6-phosphate/LysW-L-glutamyl-5-phosphate reductase